MMIWRLKNPFWMGERLPSPWAYQFLDIAKGPDYSITLICLLINLESYLLFLSHEFWEAIFLCLNHPRAKYQATKDHLYNSKLAELFTWPRLAFPVEIPGKAMVLVLPRSICCLLTTLVFFCVVLCGMLCLLSLGCVSIINFVFYVSPVFSFMTIPDWPSHTKIQNTIPLIYVSIFMTVP